MGNDWALVMQFLYLSILICIALIIKTQFKLFKKHLIPLSLIAGVFGLVLGPDVLKVIPFDKKILENIVYHAMSIGFIAIALKDRVTKKNGNILKTGILIVNVYIVQGIIGLALSLGLTATLFPTLFPISGMLLPLGFGQGPGQAYATGHSWEDPSIGFTDGGNFGLTIAAIGFLWAIAAGIPYMNYLVRKYKGQTMKQLRDSLQEGEALESLEPDNSERTSAVPRGFHIDELALQLMLIGIVYAITYGLMSGLSSFILPLGKIGQTLASVMWGFNFLWGSLIAIGVRALLNFLFKKNVVKVKYVDNYLMQRISSTMFDFMIVAAISAISFAVLKANFWPIFIITTAGGIITLIYTTYTTKLVYKEHWVEYMVMNYGTWTGTMTTGMALLREVDPKGETPVPETYVLGSGVAAGLGFPIIIFIALPAVAVSEGNPLYYWLTFIALFVYGAALTGLLTFLLKREKKKEK